MALNDVKEIAICHVIKSGNTILLVKTEEGLSKDKWNAPNTEIQKGEQPVKAAMRAVFQQTGLYVSKTTFHGTIRLFLNGKNEYNYRLQVFSTKLFSGELKPNIKGEARWFDSTDIPYAEMWADDKYWTGLVLQGKEFEADFFFDEKNEKIVKYQIREKQHVAQKLIVPIVIIALIAVVAFGSFSIFGSLKKNGATTTIKPSTPLVPNSPTTSIAPTTTIPASTTTIPPAPLAIVTINNINLIYNYTGPASFAGQQCNTPKKSNALYGTTSYTGGAKFYFNTTIYTSACNYTITAITTPTPGFKIVSIIPSVPTTVSPISTEYFEVQIVTPKANFTGPLNIVIDAN